MAVRRPLILSGSNDLIEMTDAQRNAVRDRCRYLYGANPSVTLSRVTSGGNLGTMYDTRKQAGTHTTHVSSFQPAPGISTITVNYATITESAANTTASVDTNAIAFPIYYDGAAIKAMSLTDMYDTFIFPAIDTILSAVGQPGTYRIHTGTSLSGYSAVSSSVVFSDTRANSGAYTAGGIPETRDQPTTITNYYLLQANNITAPTMEEMLFVRNSDKNLQEYTQTNIDAILQNCMRHVASEEVGSKIRYALGTSSSAVVLGSGINNTILNGGGSYNTFQAGGNDYRSQQFPNGSAVSNSFYLRMYEA